jgi:ABC-type glycerol-3-phosphate transport system permease component
LNRFWSGALTAIGTGLILLFTAGPILLALAGSVIPDASCSPATAAYSTRSRWRTTASFSPRIAAAYLESGANRTMISDAARQAPLSLWNSMQIALAALAINLVLGAPAAYVFARYGFPGKRLTFQFMILSPLVPTIALITPVYMMMQAAGLVGSKWGIILVHAMRALPFTVLILSVFFRKMPHELFEAAPDRRLHAPPIVPAHRGATRRGADGGNRPVRVHALLCGVHVRHGTFRRS